MLKELSQNFLKDFGSAPFVPKETEEFNGSIVLVSNALKNLKLKGVPLSKGLILFKKKCFASLIELNKKNIKNYLILDEKSSFLFTCNRKLFHRGVLKKSGKGPIYAVFNQKMELLGVAKREKSGLENKVNIGYYLSEDKHDEPIF
jgi:ribosome biogenesis protein Nip4